MDPARTPLAIAIFVCLGEPADFCCDAAAFTKCGEQVGANAAAASDAVEEGRLEDARDAEGGGGEKDAEGWCRADKEVLYAVSVMWVVFG